jgi:hypothetical protein
MKALLMLLVVLASLSTFSVAAQNPDRERCMTKCLDDYEDCRAACPQGIQGSECRGQCQQAYNSCKTNCPW